MIISLKKAFTLVELMIVIAIIGILAAALFPQMSQFINRSKSTTTAKEVREIFSMFTIARDEAGKTLRDVTGSACTECTCRPPSNPNYTIHSPVCLESWKTSVDKVMQYVGMRNNSKWYTDEWGYPYLLDENEGEHLLACDRLLSYGYGTYKKTSFDFGLYDSGAYTAGTVPYDLPANFPTIASTTCPGSPL